MQAVPVLLVTGSDVLEVSDGALRLEAPLRTGLNRIVAQTVVGSDRGDVALQWGTWGVGYPVDHHGDASNVESGTAIFEE